MENAASFCKQRCFASSKYEDTDKQNICIIVRTTDKT